MPIAIDKAVKKSNYAVKFLNDERPAQAEKILRKVVKAFPNSATAHYTLGLALLKQGKLEEGFRHYEGRWGMSDHGMRPVPWGEPWRGQSLSGKAMIVTWEQGFGDLFQFCRYGMDVKRLYPDCKLYLLTRIGTRSLLEPMGCWDRVIEDGEDVGADIRVHYNCPVMSLPFALKLKTPKDISGSPYIPKPKGSGLYAGSVGLCWRGNPENKKDHWRSVPWAVFRQIPDSGLANFVGLGTNEDCGLPCVVPQKDWLETARALGEMRLLITIDSGMAHLAGAMGVPCWVFIHHGSDFRWFQHSKRTPWYGSMRLFRNGPGRDWEPVVDEVIDRLTKDLASA